MLKRSGMFCVRNTDIVVNIQRARVRLHRVLSCDTLAIFKKLVANKQIKKLYSGDVYWLLKMLSPRVARMEIFKKGNGMELI